MWNPLPHPPPAVNTCSKPHPPRLGLCLDVNQCVSQGLGWWLALPLPRVIIAPLISSSTTSPPIITSPARGEKRQESLTLSLIDSSSMLLWNVIILPSVAPVGSLSVLSAGQQNNFLWSHENWAAFADCHSRKCLHMVDYPPVMKETEHCTGEKKIKSEWHIVYKVGGHFCKDVHFTHVCMWCSSV